MMDTNPEKLAGLGVGIQAAEMSKVGDQLKKDAGVASPSKETIQASQGMVQGVTETLVNSKDDVAKATETMVSPVTQKRTGPRRASTDPAVMAALEGNKETIQASRRPRRAYAPEGPPTPLRPGEKGFTGPLPQDMSPQLEKTKTSMDNMMNTVSKMSMALSSVTGILYMFGGEMQGIAGVVSMASAGMARPRSRTAL
jgi:hypothetical protein